MTEGKKARKKPLKTKSKSADAYRLRHIFKRPRNAALRHPIFNSPFTQRICAKAFKSKKPKWYRSLTESQKHSFKELVKYVEAGREGHFRFDGFLDALQEFDPTITRSEVLKIFDGMLITEFEELDFVQFLFRLAYTDQTNEDYPGNTAEKRSSKLETRRQCSILSAIAHFVLITTPADIERYYSQNTRQKAKVLHHHLGSKRLEGLTEKEMEAEQTKTAELLAALYLLTGSPYAQPVPFVYSSTEKKMKGLPFDKKQIARPLIPNKVRQEMGGKVTFDKKEMKQIKEMNNGKIPLPQMCFPSEILKQFRTGGLTIELKDYIKEKIIGILMEGHLLQHSSERKAFSITLKNKITSFFAQISPLSENDVKACFVSNKIYNSDFNEVVYSMSTKAQDAKQKYRKKLKDAAVLYAKRNLIHILREGFPSETARDAFIECYWIYLPLKVSDIQDASLYG